MEVSIYLILETLIENIKKEASNLMGINWIIFEFCNSFFGIYVMLLLSKALLNENRKTQKSQKRIQYLTYTISVFVSFFIDLIFMDNLYVISSKTIILMFVIAFVFFRANIYWYLIASFVFNILTGMAELISTFVITWAYNVEFNLVMKTTPPRFYTILATDFIVIFLIKTLTYLRKGKIDNIPVKIWLPLLILPIFSMLITIQVILVSMEQMKPYSFFSITGIVGLLYSNLIIFSIIEGALRYNEENKKLGILKDQLAIQKEHNEKLTENQFRVQQLSHDFKQQIQGLLHLCESNNYDELKKSISLFAAQQQKIKPTINTGNPMLDALLTNKKEIAERNSISCVWDINIPQNITIPIIELNALLGNAIDNAIEACQRSEKEKFIFLQMRTEESVFLCEIKNTIGQVPVKNDDRLITLKKDKLYHGIGMKSMAECCKRINGQMNYDFDEFIFEVRMLIPVVAQY